LSPTLEIWYIRVFYIKIWYPVLSKISKHYIGKNYVVFFTQKFGSILEDFFFLDNEQFFEKSFSEYLSNEFSDLNLVIAMNFFVKILKKQIPKNLPQKSNLKSSKIKKQKSKNKKQILPKLSNKN